MPRTIEAIYENGVFRLFVIVVGELTFGALNSSHPDKNLARHKKLIQRAKI